MAKQTTRRVKVTFQCNQNCVFCNKGVIFPFDKRLFSEEKIRQQIFQRKSAVRLNITGGEPTLCKKLTEYISLAKRSGYSDISIISNGVKLANKAFAAKLKQSGLTQAIISMYHFSARVNDSISGLKASFKNKNKGIKNLQDLGVPVVANIIITSLNALVIPELLSWLHKKLKIVSFVLSFLEPNCSKVASNPALIPDIRSSLEGIKLAAIYCDENKLKYYIPYNGALPPCVYKKFNLRVLKPETVYGADHDPEARKRFNFCMKCKESKYCQGFVKEYALQCIDILFESR